MEIVASFHFRSHWILFRLCVFSIPVFHRIAHAMHNDKYPLWASLVHIGGLPTTPYLDNRSANMHYVCLIKQTCHYGILSSPFFLVDFWK
jgi:hypothetical protein